jgi:trans-aconitate methyltransferase
MTATGGAATNVGAVFDAAEPGFTAWSPLLWDPVGEATVSAAAPGPGDHVLDACCGAGASTLPAARAVGPTGLVDGVDLSEQLLAAGRERAALARLSNAEFHAADVAGWTSPGRQPYDLVLCVFGVLFLPDLDAGGEHLLSLLRQGGRLAVTTWERGSVEPLIGPFTHAAAAEHAAAGQALPESTRARESSTRVDQPIALTAWLCERGGADVTVERVALDIPLNDQLAWDFATGSGVRALLFGLKTASVERIRTRFLDVLSRDRIEVLQASALIGLSTRRS